MKRPSLAALPKPCKAVFYPIWHAQAIATACLFVKPRNGVRSGGACLVRQWRRWWPMSHRVSLPVFLINMLS